MRQVIILMSRTYFRWFSELSDKEKAQIVLRLERIEFYSHFGDFKDLGEKLFELRWKNGRRIYYFHKDIHQIILLVGGLKNGQKKDIKKARSLFEKYSD